MTAPDEPRTAFDWGMYADATFAGLSVLIPVPFLDSAFEWWFSRRIAAAVARRRGQRLSPAVLNKLNQSKRDWYLTCLLLPIILIYELVKRLSRKLLYFLTIKEATDKLSYYWHRAYLIDVMLAAGHLDDPAEAQVARQAYDQVLSSSRTSPLVHLADEVVHRTRHVLRSLRRARAGKEDEVIREDRSVMMQAWEDLGAYLVEFAKRYEQAYARARAARQAQAAPEAAQS